MRQLLTGSTDWDTTSQSRQLLDCDVVAQTGTQHHSETAVGQDSTDWDTTSQSRQLLDRIAQTGTQHHSETAVDVVHRLGNITVRQLLDRIAQTGTQHHSPDSCWTGC